MLNEGVPQRRSTMIHREGDHVVLAILHPRTRVELVDLEWKGHAVHAQAHDLFERGPGRGRSENAERVGSTL